MTFAFLLLLLLSSNLVFHVGGIFKLLDQNAKLVSNAKEDVVYLFQFPRTSTTPSQAAYNLMVETWLHWKKIHFHRISNQLFLGSHSLGTAPFAYFKGNFIDGSVQIIKTVANYQLNGEEEKLMQMVLDMFNILMVDRAVGLEWMVKDEALVEVIVPQMFVNRKITVPISDDGSKTVSVNTTEEFWKHYFDVYNDKAESENAKDFVKKYLEENLAHWNPFSKWLRANVITRTLETILTETVNGQPNTANPANSQAKLKEFLKLNNLKSLANGTSRRFSEYTKDEISEELRLRWEHMKKMVEQNNNASLQQKKAQTLSDAALFGILTQYFETPLNIAKFQAISVKNGPLFEFTKKVKQSLGLNEQKWNALTKRPWQLNFDTDYIFDFTSASKKYNGPYKLEVGDLQNIKQCIVCDGINSSVSIKDNCTNEHFPPEVFESAKALLGGIAMTSAEPQKRCSYAKVLVGLMSSFLCNVGKKEAKDGCEKKHLAEVSEMYKEMKMTDKAVIKRNEENVRRTVFDTVNAYNDAKTDEAVHAAILAVRTFPDQTKVVSSTNLTNEF